MTDRENLSFGVDLIAWAYVFIYLDINLGTLDILPAWVGYKMILSSLDDLAAYEPSALLLRNLGRFMMAWTGINWVMDIFGLAPLAGSLAASLYGVAGTAIAVISIYFHFQLLTNLAQICGLFGLEERKGRFLMLRTINTILQTILSAYSVLYILQEIQWLGIGLLIVNFVNTLRITICTYGMRPELESAQSGQEDQTDRREE